MKAIIFISHGSRSQTAYQEVCQLVATLQSKVKADIFEPAFLELNDPSISQAISDAVNKGATEVVCVLNFLNSGKHVLEDVPEIIDKAKSKYPKVKFNTTPHIGSQDGMVDLYIQLINPS